MLKLIRNLKQIKNKYSGLHFISNLFLRPKKQYKLYILGLIKLVRFLYKSNKLFNISKNYSNTEIHNKQNLLIFAGNNMESSWIQIWIILSSLLSDKIANKYVVTSKKALIENTYFLRCSHNGARKKTAF